jgi:hypothetical protein
MAQLTEMVSIVLSKEQKDALEKAAAIDGRKLSAAIRFGALKYYNVLEGIDLIEAD